MDEKKCEPMMKAKDLACYILDYYKENVSDNQISDIFLQKSLYFLFAYWGGFIRQGHQDNNPEIENLSEILFEDKIEAWTYGPVVSQIYYDKKDGILEKYYKEEYKGSKLLFGSNELLRTTIDSILKDLVQIAPFKLVTLSHRDKSWSNIYCETNIHCEVDKESIINEYANRFKN